MNWKGEVMWLGPPLGCCHSICQKIQRKMMKNICQNSCFVGRDLNPGQEDAVHATIVFGASMLLGCGT